MKPLLADMVAAFVEHNLHLQSPEGSEPDKDMIEAIYQCDRRITKFGRG